MGRSDGRMVGRALGSRVRQGAGDNGTMSISLEELWELNDFTPNDNQKAAILHTDGPLYLPAGPGSGKTRVLLWRTLNLIVFHDVKPEEIYLSTFTEKAAHQLVEGIRTLLAHATNLNGKPYDISRMYVGTIHSLCNRIITDRRFARNMTRHPRPSLLDDIEQYFYLSRQWRWEKLAGELNWGESQEEINTAINVYFRKNSSSRHQAVVNCLALFNRFSEECIDPQKAMGKVEDERLRGLLGMYERYLKALAGDEAVPRTDFSLMQQAAFKILEESEGSENAFRHVIIDEYQDTNPIQEKLIFKLGAGSKNVCVVGDDDQALYRFRGATVENFVNFPEKCMKQFGVEPNLIPLDINYRSRRPIVNFYMDFMERIDWQREDNPHELYRVFKNIQAKREEEGPAVVVSTPGATEDVCREIAQLVKRLIDAGKVENANQIAFLFPSLKVEKVQTMREELEKLELKVYAPRAGSFLKVEESVAVFGVMMQIFGKVHRGEYGGFEYLEYMNWAEQAWEKGEALVRADPPALGP